MIAIDVFVIQENVEINIPQYQNIKKRNYNLTNEETIIIIKYRLDCADESI